ncbi:MAG: STAS-like domain-containing protein [Burkholderiales bacterium]|nr:STAS-like domain-containing protein [Burkholderiales bacterium]
MAFATIRISDDGEGIFTRIKRLCQLDDERQSLLELAKGKLTTDPERHSGEGVFFTSRVLDRFAIQSGGLSFSHHKGGLDFLFDHRGVHRGTTVVLDFDQVEFVGQSFADEVFRVFARQHPDMEIIPIHTNAAVGQMVARAMAGRAGPDTDG